MSVRNLERERIVRENYATMSGADIDRKFGFPKPTASNIAHRLGLKHNPEVLEAIAQQRRIMLRKNCKGREAEIGHKLHILHRIDEMRVLSGLPQLTKRKIREVPPKVYKAKWHAVHIYGYHECEGELYTLLYDEETRRKPKLEALYVKKYKFKFEQI